MNISKFELSSAMGGSNFFGTKQFLGIKSDACTWMSQEVSKKLVSGLYPQYTPFISRF